MKNFLTIAVIFILLIAGYFLFFVSEGGLKNNKQLSSTPAPTQITQAQPSIKEVNLQAFFSITTNGTKRIFTDPKYHNRSGDVYISSDNPSIVHVKKSGITWQDFFDTLPSPMRVENDCLYTGTGQVFCNSESHSLKFYLNGKKVDQVLEMEITADDRLLISFGPKDENIN